MLILSRKAGETITIGENAEIKIILVELNNKTVKVGIIAPKTIPVHREEIYEKIRAAKEEIERDKNKCK